MMDKKQVTVSISREKDAPEREYIREQLTKYNNRQIEKFEYQNEKNNLTVTLKDEDGQIVAGSVGYSSLGCFYLDMLWVSDEARGGGYGKKLLDIVEEEAHSFGCRVIELYTMGFQAPHFYPKMGFDLIGSYELYTGGPTKYFFKKAIKVES